MLKKRTITYRLLTLCFCLYHRHNLFLNSENFFPLHLLPAVKSEVKKLERQLPDFADLSAIIDD